MTEQSVAERFSPTPSLSHGPKVEVRTEVSGDATVLGLLVSGEGAVPTGLGIDRARLEAAGFEGKAGSTLIVPTVNGATMIAVGTGDTVAIEHAAFRKVGAAFARAASSHGELHLSLLGEEHVDVMATTQALTEGVLLSRYRYDALRAAGKGLPLSRLILVVEPRDEAQAALAAERGRVMAEATLLARDLANTPHNHLQARTFADVAVRLGTDRGVDVDVFDEDDLRAMGCGGLLGVNAGSTEPPRMIKLTYRPTQDASSTGTLTLVGKGIMYDSGGIALKPGDEVHAHMKNDMSGAAAILAAMSVLRDLGCRNTVIGYLMCTDNMPSGTAQALGDVITIRGGTTVEVINTDAEGRLVMADALVLATEEHTDAIVDVATLTGACMRALGTQIAGLMGNNQGVVDQVAAAAEATDEPVWQLPLDHRYDADIESPIADVRNMGTNPNGGAIHAALFLAKFVGEVPWAHIDIAGTAQSTGDSGIQTTGCTGFGARLVAQLAMDFNIPAQ